MKSIVVCCAVLTVALVGPAGAQTPPTFEGSFKGITAGIDQQMVIVRDGNSMRVRIQVKEGRCVGTVEAVGTPKQHLMTARNGACSLNMFRAGPNVQVEEEGCEAMRGPACSFTNIYAPR